MKHKLLLMTEAGKLDTSFVLGEGTSTQSPCASLCFENMAQQPKTGGDGK
jgi:hypothetical protein